MRMKRILSAFIAFILFIVPAMSLADVYDEFELITRVSKKPKYEKESTQHGTLKAQPYSTWAYAIEAVASGEYQGTLRQDADRNSLIEPSGDYSLEKDMYVYLPYGYDPSQKYNTLYILHGTGENEATWLGENSVGNTMRGMLDWMIETGEIEPLIVISITFYSIPESKKEMFTELSTHDMLAGIWGKYLWKEIRNDILPLVDQTYSTWGNDENARDHRGFFGFSQGSIATYDSIMLHCLDQFSYIGNLSALSGNIQELGKVLNSAEIHDLAIKMWYNGGGTADSPSKSHEAYMRQVLDTFPDRFQDGENCMWIEMKNGAHTYNAWFPQIYNLLHVFFTR